MKNNSLILIFVSVLLFLGSCKPQQDDAIELSAVPSNISFTVEEKAGETNTYILTNTSPAGPFLFQWELGGSIATGQTAEVYYPLMGDYEVSLRAFNDGGFGTSSKTITVLEDDPNPCQSGSLIEFLTNCDQLTWKLLQDEGAYWVGPTDNSQTWWMNAAADVTTRFCAFDDEWTFNVLTGEMIYDTKGDLWAEDYMGFPNECVTDDQLADDFKPWASGTHTFVASNTGGLEQIQVNGLGAFMGLPKATNGAEVTAPVSSITYDVINRGTDANGKFLEIEVNYSAGIWRFKFVAQ